MVGLYSVRIHIRQDGLIITLLWVTLHNNWAQWLTSPAHNQTYHAPRHRYVQGNVDLRNLHVVSAKTRGRDKTSVCDKLVWQGAAFETEIWNDARHTFKLCCAAAEVRTETPLPMVVHAFRPNVTPPQRIRTPTVQTVSGAVQWLLSRFPPTCGMRVLVLLDQRLLSNHSATPSRQAHIVLRAGRNKA